MFYVNSEGTHCLVAAAQDQHTLNDVIWFYRADDNLNNPVNHDSQGVKYSE